jgi:hypothetical protein
VKTYGALVANSDSYYNENVVLGDLRAGVYELSIAYGPDILVNIQIFPGRITFFSFYGYYGYDFTPPSVPEIGMP